MGNTPEWVLEKLKVVQDRHLTTLDLSVKYPEKGDLEEIPPETFALNWLTKLTIERHQITRIPPAIAQLKDLQELNLGSNQISEIPPAIAKLHHLEILELRDNQIEKIPQAIAQLQNLKILDLESNQIHEIPAAIAQLKKLENLDLGWNNITKIPEKIIFCPNLKQLEIFNNHLESLPHEILEKGLDGIREYYQNLHHLGIEYLYEAKLLVVGDTNTGKTTLVSQIIHSVDPEVEIPPGVPTSGIEIHEWKFPYQNQEFHANIWDFGGQDKYYAIHQFFLTKRSLYVLVLDERKDQTNFNYWVHLIHLFSEDSPVIILLNQKSGITPKIDEHELRKLLPNLQEIITVDFSDQVLMLAVTQTMKKHLQSLKHLGDRLTSSWINFRTFLATEGKNNLSLQEYLDLCDDFGIRDLKQKLALSQYLHDLGIIVHLQADSRLKDIVILHPEWAINALYQILDHPEIIANYGIFSRQDLSVASINTAFEMMQDEVLSLMLKFQQCYRLTPTANNYICPQLLNLEHPRYKWNPNQNLVVRYRYEFMPKGIVNRLIVILKQYLINQQLIWHNGVILGLGETRAELLADETKRIIQVRVRGDQRRQLLMQISHALESLHESYRHLNIQKFIPCNCAVCLASTTPYLYEQEVVERYIKSGRNTIQCHKSSTEIDTQNLLDYICLTESIGSGKSSADQHSSPVSPEKNLAIANTAQIFTTATMADQTNLKLPLSFLRASRLIALCFFSSVTFLLFTGKISAIYWAIILLVLSIFYIIIGVLYLRSSDKFKNISIATLIQSVIQQVFLVSKAK